mgnify:CR=1 FL=1
MHPPDLPELREVCPGLYGGWQDSGVSVRAVTVPLGRMTWRRAALLAESDAIVKRLARGWSLPG